MVLTGGGGKIVMLLDFPLGSPFQLYLNSRIFFSTGIQRSLSLEVISFLRIKWVNSGCTTSIHPHHLDVLVSWLDNAYSFPHPRDPSYVSFLLGNRPTICRSFSYKRLSNEQPQGDRRQSYWSEGRSALGLTLERAMAVTNHDLRTRKGIGNLDVRGCIPSCW